MASITFSNTEKWFDEIPAIRNFNLDIRDGEFLVLVGPSGCGKTTLLRLLAGLEKSSSGEIYINEKNMTDVASKDRDIAMVFQNFALYPHLDVYNNMAFGLKLRNYSNKKIKEMVHDTAEILRIESLLNRKPKELSGGQKQRVALGRAIVRKPAVFLFDEPLSNLDAKLRVQMRLEIKNLHRELKTTMVYVTHDQVEAMTLGDRLVILNDGSIQQVGPPLELYHEPKNIFVAGFIGSPPMNFLSGTAFGSIFKVDDYSLDIGKLVKDYGFDGRNLVLGIRPENIQSKDSGIELPILAKEPLGNEFIIYLKIGKEIIVVRTQDVKNESMKIGLDLDKTYLFDPKTKERIL